MNTKGLECLHLNIGVGSVPVFEDTVDIDVVSFLTGHVLFSGVSSNIAHEL